MSKKQSSPSLLASVGRRTTEQLISLGLLFMLAPYVQAKLSPIRADLYKSGNLGPTALGGAPPPKLPQTVGGGSDTIDNAPDVTTSYSPVQSIAGLTFNGTSGNAPTGQAPVPATNPNELAPLAGPLGGLFIQ